MSHESIVKKETGASPKKSVFGSFAEKTVELLIVEDDLLFGQLLVSLMHSSKLADFNVTLARTLHEGLEHLATGQCEVILLDLFLPDSDGLDTLERIRAGYSNIPVVVLTGMDNHDMASAAIEQGAQDYLVKGIDKTMDRSLLYALERDRIHKELFQSQSTLREAQMRLIQADKLESIGRMAAGVAHEVKNPLAILRMGVEYLETALDKSSDQNLASTCSDMNDAVSRAQSIINGMLDFSIPTDLEKGFENVPKVIQESVRMVSHEFKIRNIDLVVKFPENLPEVNMDRRKIQQVLVNILTNSAHAVGQNGVIEIRVDTNLLDQVGNGVGSRESDIFKLGQKLVIIRILDSGKGISDEEMTKLFDPFFSSKPVGEGTGLGLPICKNIIELHGGKIEISNREEGGAAATIMLIA